MKKYLLAAVVALAIGGVAHATDFTCHLTDQRGNILDYTFRPNPGFTSVEELGFTRNGQKTNYDHTPIWNATNQPSVGGTTLFSNDDPGWSIAYPTAPGNNHMATLWHNRSGGRSYPVAAGSCYDVPTIASAPAYTPPPHADEFSIVCGGYHILVGDNGADGVVQTNITINAGRGGARAGANWYVTHTLANGQVVTRNDQYNVANSTNPGDGSASWSGRSIRWPNKWMRGQLGVDNRHALAYDEWLYDRGVLVMHSSSECSGRKSSGDYVSNPPAYNPNPSPEPIPPASPSGEDSVGLINVGKGVLVQVMLGSHPVTMLVDTGATDMGVSSKLAAQLVADGDATYGDDVNVKQADGKTISERSITIHSLTIGRHTVKEVKASVADDDDAMSLLPFSVLSRAGRFTIDVVNNKLIFG